MEKYRAKKNEIDWIKFSSILESRFYNWFKSNNIEILALQPRYTLMEWFMYQGKAIRKIEYVADFLIIFDGDTFVVDAKGLELDIFKLKIKIWKKLYWEKYNLIIATSIKDLEKQLLK